MAVVKTETGLKVLKDRSVSLSPRQRSAFILFDGQRSVEEVLAATEAMGVTAQDIAYLMEAGLLEDLGGSPAPVAPPAVMQQPAPSAEDLQARYQMAYPIATRLTAGLGLRGFRLNLAIEAANSYEKLRDLAPKIREAVGDDQYRELERALRG